jgi:hypothetical protein
VSILCWSGIHPLLQAKIGTVGLLWAGIEEGVTRYGKSLEPAKETVAGFGTAVVFSAGTRLGMPNSGRAVMLGTLVGAAMSVLRIGESYSIWTIECLFNNSIGQDRIGSRISDKGASRGG